MRFLPHSSGRLKLLTSENTFTNDRAKTFCLATRKLAVFSVRCSAKNPVTRHAINDHHIQSDEQQCVQRESPYSRSHQPICNIYLLTVSNSGLLSGHRRPVPWLIFRSSLSVFSQKETFYPLTLNFDLWPCPSNFVKVRSRGTIKPNI